MSADGDLEVCLPLAAIQTLYEALYESSASFIAHEACLPLGREGRGVEGTVHGDGAIPDQAL